MVAIDPWKLRIFDAHLHTINQHFPLVANQGYLPEKFSVDQYLQKTLEFDLVGGTVVSGSRAI